MEYKYAVIDRMTDGLGDETAYNDPRKIVSRHVTHEAAERAANRRGGDRFAIIEIVSDVTAAARALGESLRRHEWKHREGSHAPMIGMRSATRNTA